MTLFGRQQRCYNVETTSGFPINRLLIKSTSIVRLRSRQVNRAIIGYRKMNLESFCLHFCRRKNKFSYHAHYNAYHAMKRVQKSCTFSAYAKTHLDSHTFIAFLRVRRESH